MARVRIDTTAVAITIVLGLTWMTLIFLAFGREPLTQETGAVEARFAVVEPDAEPTDESWAAMTYRVDAAEEVPGRLSLANRLGRSADCEVLSFVDYVQVPFVIGGVERSHHRLSLPDGEVSEYPVLLPAVAQGDHPVVQMVFWDLELPMTEDARMGTADARFAAIRFLLDGGVGEPDVPPVWAAADALPNDGGARGLGIAPPEGSDRAFTIDERARAGVPYQFTVQVANPSAAAMPFVLIVLVDYEQTPFTEKGDLLVSGVVPARSIVPISAALVLDTPGVHEVQAVRVSGPYDAAWYEHMSADQGLMVSTSVRFPLAVEP